MTMKKALRSIRKTIGDILFAAVFASVIGALFMKSYAIPTSSMEGTMLVGDHMFVSKFHYGAKLPQTPLQIPLTHQKIWGTDIPAYLDWVKLPYMRLPGLEQVKNNDIVVFNYPRELDEYPVDLRTFYVKRCIGIAGDTLEIAKGQVLINGKELINKGIQQQSYLLLTETSIRDKFFESKGIHDHYKINGGYLIHTNSETAKDIENLSFITSLKKLESEELFGSQNTYGDVSSQWNADDYGPIYIPKKGDTVQLDDENLALYKDIILYYDWNENAEFKNGKIFIDGKEIHSYTFRQNYYFMMGDNRHNSEDSRFWGFVPEDHIVGKPLFIYWSTGKSEGFFDYFSSIRWDRFLKWVGDS